ncbi:aldehyde ferredoxin oxidoreductase family protein [Geoglobus acetivorans]|uniref:Aldehyde:ferredoxin oxidoreductase n=1 Tax=Geoglobus acetivorans TaxID=565033 RepID=A0A0A7GCR5_GEOAI|nr:aldehyde:ferredoxin oxidoreductase [Geoglobus acetivorans]
MVLNRKLGIIDLGKNRVLVREIPVELRKKHLGGRGLNWYYLYNSIRPDVDPYSPENVLAIGAGLLTGFPALGAGRTQISTKNPMTGGVGDSNMGGAFGPQLRLAGFDHLLIVGRAEKPSYILVRDGGIEIRSAEHLWGLDTHTAQKVLREETGDDRAESMVIGRAGENLVSFANVMNGIKNAGGRSGTGAVMGSKNLKAIVASGDIDLVVHDPEKLLDYALEVDRRARNTKWAKTLGRLGTPLLYDVSYTTGFIGTLNWQYNTPGEDGKPLEAENLEKYSVKMVACIGCSVHCRHRVKIREGRYRGVVTEGPEYAAIGAFGTGVGVYDWEFVIKCNEMANKWGIDLISLGTTVAWAFELFQRGYITENDTGGLRLEWGDENAVLELAKMIVERKNVGNVLADGMLKASEKFGKDSLYYANQTKGHPNLLTDERGIPSFALGIATSTRGADHLRSRPGIDLFQLPEETLERIYGHRIVSDFTAYETKGIMVWWHELLYNVVDSLGICKFQTVFNSANSPRFEDYVPLIEFAAGIRMTKEDLMEIGERNYTIERMFNVLNGFSRKDDYPPERYFREETKRGLPFMKGRKLDREKYDMMLEEYYRQHGWDENGVPKRETLERLGISEPDYSILEVL